MLTLALTISLFTIGIHAATWDGMILEPIRIWLDSKLSNKYGKYVKKPLYECLICMSSVWTIIYSLLNYGCINTSTFILIIVVAGINTLLMHFIYWLKGYEQ
jgi:hypothetical protein